MGHKISLEENLDIIEVKLVSLPEEYPNSKYGFLDIFYTSALSLDSPLEIISKKIETLFLEDIRVRDIKIVSVDTKGQPLYHIQDGIFPHYSVMEDYIINGDVLPSSKFERVALDQIQELKFVKVVEWYFRWTYELDNYKTLREFLLTKYPDDTDLKENVQYVVFKNVSKFNTYNTSVKYYVQTNNVIGYSIKDLNPKYYNRLMIHGTYGYENIKKEGFLCNSGQCDIAGYNEKTGIWNPKVKMNPRETIPENPGIYFTPSNLDESLIMTSDSNFSIDKNLEVTYGDIGIVYTAEFLFKNYRVNLKNNQDFGFGTEITPDDYFNLAGDEAIVRANKISLKNIKCYAIMMNYSELKFIYDTFGYDNIKWSSIIKLYRDKWKEKWYLRKSNLLKILKTHPVNKVPPIIIGYSKFSFKKEYELYGGAFDIDSDSF